MLLDSGNWRDSAWCRWEVICSLLRWVSREAWSHGLQHSGARLGEKWLLQPRPCGANGSVNYFKAWTWSTLWGGSRIRSYQYPHRFRMDGLSKWSYKWSALRMPSWSWFRINWWNQWRVRLLLIVQHHIKFCQISSSKDKVLHRFCTKVAQLLLNDCKSAKRGFQKPPNADVSHGAWSYQLRQLVALHGHLCSPASKLQEHEVNGS